MMGDFATPKKEFDAGFDASSQIRFDRTDFLVGTTLESRHIQGWYWLDFAFERDVYSVE